MPSATTSYPSGVQKLPADAPLQDVFNLLKRDGGVFIKGLISEDDVDKAWGECRERLENDVAWDGEFFPREQSSFKRIQASMDVILS